MTTVLQQALRSLLLICFVNGLGVYPVKQQTLRIRWIICLSILYSLTFWSFYIYVICYINAAFELRVIVKSIFNFVVIVINILVTIISSFVAFYYHKRFEICMIKLDAVDNTLEQLGISKIHKRIYSWSNQMIIGWFCFVCIINFYNTHAFAKDLTTFWALIVAIVLTHCTNANILVDLLFIIFLWYIGNRFDKIHELIKCQLVKKELRTRNAQNSLVIVSHRSTKHYKQIFWTTMHLHLELNHIAHELNMIFGIQMTLQTLSYLIYITIICYNIFIVISNDMILAEVSLLDFFMGSVSIFSLIIRMYIINCFCDRVSHKSNSITKINHQLTVIAQYTDIWKEISQFTLQAMHHPLQFSGMGLFCFGHNFILKVYVTISTYVLIMVQLEDPKHFINT